MGGDSLFLFEQRIGIGPGTASFYTAQATRLLCQFCQADLPERLDQSASA
jgi:hypothetical protein